MEASNLRQEALRQGNTPGHQNDDVATIAWIGYDAFQVPGWNDVTGSVEGGWGVSHDDVARTGGAEPGQLLRRPAIRPRGRPGSVAAIGHF